MPAAMSAAPPSPVTFTILHTNDFHGQLEASGSNPGMARVAAKVAEVRAAKGASNVLLVDGGDEMQGSLLSNLQKGLPTIATFNAMAYDAATFGNHEFDWGQDNLIARTTQAAYPFLSANIVSGTCDAANWTSPSFTQPFIVKPVGTAPDTVKVAFIGVTTQETPTITVATATAGLCFKDPADSILHYYDAMKAQADVIVVLSHLGYTDGGYGYGIPVYGDQTLAGKLNTAGKPVNLIVGGHSHTNLAAATVVGTTSIVQAYYNGRNLGQADITVGTDGSVATVWTRNSISTSGPEDAAVKAVITGYSSDPAYQTLVNTPIGYSAVDLPRNGGTVDNMMGTFIDDAIYNYLNTDADPANDIDLFFNNAGGIRTDWCYNGSAWVNTGCAAGLHTPALLTYGNMFTVLPFGNATVVGTMTGAEILDVMNNGPKIAGVIQPAGIEYTYYAYKDANPGPQPWAWGAYDACVVNKTTHVCDPLDVTKTYKVGTNEFLAPGGGDGYLAFKYMKNITYWGDMLNAVNAYVSTTYGTLETAYEGPNGDGSLDGRIVRDGDNTTGSIVPVTILHNNDSHGNLAKTTFVGYTQLATLIKQERLHNPQRTILLDGGDQIQGDAMMYYFKSAPLGYAADGTALPPELQTHPMMAVMNSLGYDAMTLGNHEFNFGGTIFDAVMEQAGFAVLGANVTDSGAYGLDEANGGTGVQPYLEKTVGPEGIKVGIIGITNHRVPNYELPSNIPGLTFSDPIVKAQQLATQLRSQEDAVVALTHIGFTENPGSVEIDNNVDTNMAAQVTGLDAIVGAHSHTDPSKQSAASGAYKYLPAIVAGPNNTPVIVTQAYRYNNYLGEVVLGMRAKAGGGYEVVSRTGQYLAVTSSTPEDAATKAIVDPYVTALNAYNNLVVGETTAPIDTMSAFTAETNGANLQADASVFELAKHNISVDVHISGAMTNKLIATSATPASPVTLKVSDMFAAMPYENSLVVLRMNGPQLKAVLERAYRNYYYYKYVPGFGGYSYYTTCMLDTNKVGQITYNDQSPLPYDPSRSYVKSFTINGHAVDFTDASTYYRVSTVNYLAAGSCNFNDGGVSLWPLNQIVNDTQYYVRDAVIDYITEVKTVSPAIEGRLVFIPGDIDPPLLSVGGVRATSYLHYSKLTPTFSASDADSGVAFLVGMLDGRRITSARAIDLRTLKIGYHTLVVTATDGKNNLATTSIRFRIVSSIPNLTAEVKQYAAEHRITSTAVKNLLLAELSAAKSDQSRGLTAQAVAHLSRFVSLAARYSGSRIMSGPAGVMIDDAIYLMKSIRSID